MPFYSLILNSAFLTNADKKPLCCPTIRNNRFFKDKHGHSREQCATPAKVEHICVEADCASQVTNHDKRQRLDQSS